MTRIGIALFSTSVSVLAPGCDAPGSLGATSTVQQAGTVSPAPAGDSSSETTTTILSIDPGALVAESDEEATMARELAAIAQSLTAITTSLVMEGYELSQADSLGFADLGEEPTITVAFADGAGSDYARMMEAYDRLAAESRRLDAERARNTVDRARYAAGTQRCLERAEELKADIAAAETYNPFRALAQWHAGLLDSLRRSVDLNNRYLDEFQELIRAIDARERAISDRQIEISRIQYNLLAPPPRMP